MDRGGLVGTVKLKARFWRFPVGHGHGRVSMVSAIVVGAEGSYAVFFGRYAGGLTIIEAAMPSDTTA